MGLVLRAREESDEKDTFERVRLWLEEEIGQAPSKAEPPLRDDDFEFVKAAMGGNANLVEACADSVDMDGVFMGGYNALMHASCGGHVEIVRFLISKGANVNAKSRWESSALEIAYDAGFDARGDDAADLHEVMSLLKEAGAENPRDLR